MPYWSSSRVGAMPQGHALKPKKRNEASNARRKGITMEDLKKQTAIRLAQEQQQQQQSRVGPPNTYPPRHELPDGVVQGFYGAKSPGVLPQRDRLAYPNNGRSTEEIVQYENSFDDRPGATLNSGPLLYESYGGHGVSEEDLVIIQGKRPSPRAINNRDEALFGVPEYSNRSSSSNISHSSSSFDSLNQHLLPPSVAAKGKLPHGLTVQELKEMTKARLQAEASEKGDKRSETSGQSAVPTTPTQFRDQTPRQTSNVPPGFPSQSLPTSFSYGDIDNIRPSPITGIEGWSLESRGEAWETGSVSTSASDYPASESVYSSGANGISSFSDDVAAPSPFGHTFYVPSSQEPPHRDGPASPFIDGGNINRPRSLTLSPRVLSTRLYYPGQDVPGIPSLASKPGLSHNLTMRARPQVLSADTGRYGYRPIVNSQILEGNRDRASSAASLPPISHTADEFSPEYSVGFQRQFAVVHEDAPSGVTGLSDVFREPAGMFTHQSNSMGSVIMRAPSPALMERHPTRYDESRARASTWGEQSSQIFGPGLISTSEDDLAGDLASILKLSAPDAKPGRDYLFPPPGFT